MTDENMEPLPNTFTVHVDYDDAHGRRHYMDSFTLTTATLLAGTITRPSASNDVQKRIAAGLEAIARGVGSA